MPASTPMESHCGAVTGRRRDVVCAFSCGGRVDRLGQRAMKSCLNRMSCGDNAERAESIPLTIDRERITGAQAQIDSFGSPSITRCARLGVVQAATGWNRSSTRWKQMASLTRGSTDALNRFCVESSVGPRRSASVAPACGGGPVPSQRFPNTARQRRD